MSNPTNPAAAPHTALAEIARQLGEIRLWLDLGATNAARAQVGHTQALVLELARVTRLDAMFSGM